MKSQIGSRVVWVALALLGLGAVSGGCGDDPPAKTPPVTTGCSDDSQCEGGACILGQCRECRDDSQCGEGMRCVSQSCEVVDTTDVGFDVEDDGGGEVGVDEDADSGVDEETDTDTPVIDCGQGCTGLQVCDVATNTCREPRICLADEDCLVNRYCFDGACTSNVALQAAGGCLDDGDCGGEGGGSFCNLETRRCTPREACEADRDCPSGLRCDTDGVCRVCLEDAHCGGNLLCDRQEESVTRGLCLERSGICADSTWCRGDRVCLGGACQEPACGEDELVGNQGCGQAASISTEATYALQICGASCDWFAVAVEAGDGLLARIVHDPNDGDLDLRLRGAPCEGGGVLDAATSLRAAEVVSLPVAFEAGTYYLEVCPYLSAFDQGTAPYMMDVQIVKGGFCLEDALEGASGSNDLPEDAARIPADARPFTWSRQDLQLCPERPDWYTLPLVEGDLVDLGLVFEDRIGNLALEVYDLLPTPGVDAPRWRSDGRTNGERLIFRAEATGEVWVHVAPATPAGQVPYELSVAIYGGAACGDALEPEGSANNSRGQATRLDGPRSFAALQLCGNDIDWFEAPVGAGQAATFQVRYDADGPSELKATVFRRSGDPQPLVITGRDGVLNVSTTAAAADPVALRIEAVTPGVTVPYALVYRAVPEAESCLDDARENHDAATAWPSPFGVQELGGELCPGQADYFVFDVPDNTRLMADLFADGAAGDLTLELLDGAEAVLASGVPSEAGLSTSVERAVGGEVLAVVRGSSPTTAGSYLLQVYAQPITTPGTCGQDALEPGSADANLPNNTFTNGAEIPAGEWVTHLIACPGEVDWYRVFAPAGMDLRVSVETHTLASGVLDVQLWGVDGPPSALSEREGVDGGLLEIVVPWYAIFDGGLQGVEVRSTTGDTIWYDLRVDVLP